MQEFGLLVLCVCVGVGGYSVGASQRFWLHCLIVGFKDE